MLLIQVVGTMVVALIEAICYYYWLVDADDDVSDEEDAEDVLEVQIVDIHLDGSEWSRERRRVRRVK
jgi:hypothetical protein